ncbi:MAG: hypothetical protein KDI71_10355 [Xanthomonadales bacterium]|nr:hypothetical protein [Xanthomonadales bacterium]
MNSTSTLRVASWLTVFLGLAVFFCLGRAGTPNEPDREGVMLSVLPYLVSNLGVLGLLWAGPFPEHWPFGNQARYSRRLFWWVGGVLVAFWLYFFFVFLS